MPLVSGSLRMMRGSSTKDVGITARETMRRSVATLTAEANA